MTIQEEIARVAEQFYNVKNIENVEVATICIGVCAVWINGKRFGTYDVRKSEFITIMT